ncbi:hypothetical protein [Lapidilactobacillus wuchangensis]|uniref:hypothetical protein n=1 Tax=Lapidilactobacillus wuchangensis TaxID=2486001 RepID=UPI0013DDBBB8|nr:hypothetical protein [Lapidilactobacillus wuchangensis]
MLVSAIWFSKQWYSIQLVYSGRGRAIGVNGEIILAALAVRIRLVFEIVAQQ